MKTSKALLMAAWALVEIDLEELNAAVDDEFTEEDRAHALLKLKRVAQKEILSPDFEAPELRTVECIIAAVDMVAGEILKGEPWDYRLAQEIISTGTTFTRRTK